MRIFVDRGHDGERRGIDGHLRRRGHGLERDDCGDGDRKRGRGRR